MPHLSPMKWFNLFIIMILIMLIFIIQMNFLISFKPKKNEFKNFNKMLWKI